MFQGSLLGLGDEVALEPLGSSVRRTPLSHGAWIDLRPGWVTGADALFERLVEGVPWRAERRRMYDRTVDVPRLLSFYDEGATLPDPVLAEAMRALSEHYGDELGEPFRTAGLCLYRDGRDSVAWHGDRIGRGDKQDTMVAIVSIGTPRALMLRPRDGGGPRANGAGGSRANDGGGSRANDGGGSRANDGGPGSGAGSPGSDGGGARRLLLGHGDLVVMGGSCQRTWDHAIPKTSRPTGPRISVQFRPRGVR